MHLVVALVWRTEDTGLPLKSPKQIIDKNAAGGCQCSDLNKTRSNVCGCLRYCNAFEAAKLGQHCYDNVSAWFSSEAKHA